MRLPLSGLRIVSVEQYGALPHGTMHLADLGAEVIRIEPPDDGSGFPGDMARHTGGFPLGPNDSQFYQTFNRNKRAITLDLSCAEGRAVLHRLVQQAEAVANNGCAATCRRVLAFDYAALSAVKPEIVCLHCPAMAATMSAPPGRPTTTWRRPRRGMPPSPASPTGPPTRAGLSLVDMMSGLTATSPCWRR